LFGRNDNPCGYDTLVITLLLGKRFGTSDSSDFDGSLQGDIKII